MDHNGLVLNILTLFTFVRKNWIYYFRFFKIWNDCKLKWNKSNYADLDKYDQYKLPSMSFTFWSVGVSSVNFRLALTQHEIWQPDIALLNSLNHNIDYSKGEHLFAASDGTVVWVPPANFKSFCDSNLRNWPFDSQTCILPVKFQYILCHWLCVQLVNIWWGFDADFL